jgi:HD-GYP domain-containing protein (c-di-GMP phosphodiesterase class II)
VLNTVPATWQRYRWRAALLGGLLALAAVMLALGGLSVRSLRQAQEDHRLLERIRTVELVSERMFRAAADYHANAPRNFSDYARDTQIYYRQLQADRRQLEDSIRLLATTEAGGKGGDPAVAGAAASLAVTWNAFERELASQLGPDPDEPRLEWGSRHIAGQVLPLRTEIDALATAAMARTESRLDRASRLATVVVPATVLGLALLLALLALRLQRRIECMVGTGRDLVRGRFGAPPRYAGEDDFSAVDRALSQASLRIASALALIDGVQRARKVQGLLEQFRQTAGDILSIDWMALYFVDGEPSMATRRAVSGSPPELPEVFRLARTPDQAWVDLDYGPARAEPEINAAGPVRPAALWLPSDGQQGFLLLMAPAYGQGWREADTDFMAHLAPLLAHGLEKVELTERLLVAAISGLARLAESRDPETGNHLLRMSEYSRAISLGLREAGGPDAAAIDDAFVEDIHRFAPMHDIGKVGVPDAILRKPGRLDEDEMAQMREHPRIGGEVLRACREQLPQLDGKLFQLAIDIAEGHHEKFDGSGYPRGLSGKDIPLAGRIIAVADVLDALASRRPYKEPWPMERVWAYLVEQRGIHFDPEVVDAALHMRAAILDIRDLHSIE